MAAPIVPAINDSELERILDAAAAQGATGAGMILLRLPGEDARAREYERFVDDLKIAVTQLQRNRAA